MQAALCSDKLKRRGVPGPKAADERTDPASTEIQGTRDGFRHFPEARVPTGREDHVFNGRQRLPEGLEGFGLLVSNNGSPVRSTRYR